MVDYPYVECSSACVQAMSKFRAVFPKYKPLEIEKSIQAGLKYIKKVQRDDGSWYVVSCRLLTLPGASTRLFHVTLLCY